VRFDSPLEGPADGLQVLHVCHRLGTARHRARGQLGAARDNDRGRALNANFFCRSCCDMDLREEFPLLVGRRQLEESYYGVQQGIWAAVFDLHTRQEIRADHLQTITARLI